MRNSYAKPIHPVTQEQLNSLGSCKKCGAKEAWSTKVNKPFCSAKCWLNKAPQELPTIQGGEDLDQMMNIPF